MICQDWDPTHRQSSARLLWPARSPYPFGHRAWPATPAGPGHPVEAFRSFRRWTEGASAIQSYSYKLVESLCRRPELSRLNSIAYQATPDIRARAIAGQPTVESRVGELVRGGLPASIEGQLAVEMDAFAGALTAWRRTHYSLAVRMLGNRTGTGFTDGTAYLKDVKDIPVFNRKRATCDAPPGGAA